MDIPCIHVAHWLHIEYTLDTHWIFIEYILDTHWIHWLHIDHKNFDLKKILPPKFLIQQFCWPKKNLTKKFLTQNFLTKFWKKTNFDPRQILTQNKFGPKTNIWPKKVFDPKILFLPKKISWLKFFLTQKNVFPNKNHDQKNCFDPKIFFFDSQNFFSHKILSTLKIWSYTNFLEV